MVLEVLGFVDDGGVVADSGAVDGLVEQVGGFLASELVDLLGWDYVGVRKAIGRT